MALLLSPKARQKSCTSMLPTMMSVHVHDISAMHSSGLFDTFTTTSDGVSRHHAQPALTENPHEPCEHESLAQILGGLLSTIRLNDALSLTFLSVILIVSIPFPKSGS